jgi:hypothetical protein
LRRFSVTISRVRRPILALVVLCLAGGAASAAVLRAGAGFDPTKVPLGDGRYTTSAPKKGYVYSCGPHTGGGGAHVNGPWIHGKTWDSTAKVYVQGSVHWKTVLRITVSGAKLKITTNGLPNHPTGIFPVQAGTAAAAYDRNPNSIRAQKLS